MATNIVPSITYNTQTAGVAPTNSYAVDDAKSRADVLAGAAASAGTTLADLAEKKRQFDADLEQKKLEWAQQGMPALQIQQQAQALAQQEFQAQTQIAQGNLALAQKAQSDTNTLGQGQLALAQTTQSQQNAIATRQADLAQQVQLGQLTIDQANAQLADFIQKGQLSLAQTTQAQNYQIAQGNLGVSQGNLGLDYLKTAASLGGPSNYYQAAAFERGAQGNSAVPAFLSSLSSNTGMPAFNQAGSTPSSVQSMGTLAGGLTGSTPAAGAAPAAAGGAPPASDNGLSTIAKLGAAGGQALAPQALENLNPDEMGLLQSGLTASGYSVPAFLQQYQQAKIGQTATKAA